MSSLRNPVEVQRPNLADDSTAKSIVIRTPTIRCDEHRHAHTKESPSKCIVMVS